MDEILSNPTVAILLVIVIGQAVGSLVSRILSEKRERDLLNRLMARNFAEYTTATKSLKEKPAEPSIQYLRDQAAIDNEGYSADGTSVA